MSRTTTCLAVAGICVASVAAAFTAGTLIGQEPKVSPPRVFELRTYYTIDGRMPALQARFKNHTLKLFEKHGMKNEMYWTPILTNLDDVKAKNTLIYVVSHDSMEAAQKSWNDFRNDPEWHKARDESEKDGKIVEKVESVYMTLAEFSPKTK